VTLCEKGYKEIITDLKPPLDENILGTLVHSVTIAQAAALLEAWAEEKTSGYVCPATVYSVMSAYRSPKYREVVNASMLTIPDGMPLVWVLRLYGHRPTRVHGPDLMLGVCKRSPGNGIRHFLLGGAPGQADEVADVLENQYPGIEIVGVVSTPHDTWSEADNRSAVTEIQSSGANLVWVGMGTPWQDEWAAQYASEIQGPVIGMGSAFDFISGRVPWAPDWIQRTGLQWLYRFLQEPRRLWRRYLINNPLFVVLVLFQIMGINKFQTD
jgi:N-acetylglucosaminyldiphosphoundecaprenol N-acetyl-beta-D-mannosaminyltransferase